MADVFETYTLIESISASAESDVHLVQHKQTGERFLLKCLKDTQQPGREKIQRTIRFQREMDIVTSLNHPKIARPVETCLDDTTTAMLYPYREGQALARAVLPGESLREADAINIVVQLLDALEYIHSRGIVHVDINPHNIFLDHEKNVSLLDFGISMTDDEVVGLCEGRVYGTFPYLSPEQMGFTEFTIDSRTDLYDAALILYRLLTGRMPFDLTEETVEELLNRVLRTEVQPSHKVPLALNAILLKGLKPTPVDRYQTAAGFKADLLEALEHITLDKRDTFVPGRIDAVTAVNRQRLFVARTREVELLMRGLHQLQRAQNVSYCLYGRSGIGKTEIIREFKRSIGEHRVWMVAARCTTFSPQQPFSILRHIVLEFLNRANASGEVAVEQLLAQETLREHSGTICKILPELSPYFGDIRSVDKVEPEKEADRTTQVLASLLSAFCASKPLVLFIDDLQWVDKGSFVILRRLLTAETPLMTVATLRTEKDEDAAVYLFGEELQKCGIKQLLRIRAFGRVEIRDLIFARFGEIAEADTLTGILAERTDCSPFALTEAFRFLVNNGFLNSAGERWLLSLSAADELPATLDPLALILRRLEKFTEAENRWLECASLAPGHILPELVTRVSGGAASSGEEICERLISAGLLASQSGGTLRFVHDRIKESIQSRIPTARKTGWYERFGSAYERMAAENPELLFNAAESYLKSTNLTKAVELCFRAARFAAEKVALDVATNYFTKAQLMVGQCQRSGLTPPVDSRQVQIEFGDVLMLTGRNEQALKVFQSLLASDPPPEKKLIRELRFKIGCIYHYMGEFEKSIPVFIDALRLFGIRVPTNRFKIVGLALALMLVHFFWAPLARRLGTPTTDPDAHVKQKILSKLAYSLYFFDTLQCFYVLFKALNHSDRLPDCVEKAEIYALNAVPTFQMLLKRRAMRFLNRAENISREQNRKDGIAIAQSMRGIVHYFDSRWPESETNLASSMALLQSIGDNSNQIVSAEHIWRIPLMRGDLPAALEAVRKTLLLSAHATEKHYQFTALAAQHYIGTLQGQPQASTVVASIEQFARQTNSYLSRSHVEAFLLQTEMANEQWEPAFRRVCALLKVINPQFANAEYNVMLYASFAELIARELDARRRQERQLPLSTPRLILQFLLTLPVHALSAVTFPAYRGSFYRTWALFCSALSLPGMAHLLYRRSIRVCHDLGMRYEEARAKKAYGRFLASRNRPGISQDYYNAAYELFGRCGASFECRRLERLVDADLVAHGAGDQVNHDTEATRQTAESLRLDTLYDMSLALTQAHDSETLLHDIVRAMLKATGAQIGLLQLFGDQQHEMREICLDFDNRPVGRESLPGIEPMLEFAATQKRIVTLAELTADRPGDKAGLAQGSAMCVPLVREGHALGAVYLVNRLVTGLFSEYARKAAQIISGQACFLIENAYLMEEYKRLNARLEQKVREQTADIREKNKQLADYGVRVVESERMRTLLSGALVHDIKNYVTGIDGYGTILKRNYPNEPRVQKASRIIAESCSGIVSLASNILDIGKMEEGKLVLKKERLTAGDVFAMAEPLGNQSAFEEKGIVVELVEPQEAFEIEADRYLVERILQNLFSNAAKYVPDNGQVRLILTSTQRERIISLYNSGMPIPEEHRLHLFDKYGRLERSSSQYSKGLGLFFCKMVMNAHGGQIRLRTDETGNFFEMGFVKAS